MQFDVLHNVGLLSILYHAITMTNTKYNNSTLGIHNMIDVAVEHKTIHIHGFLCARDSLQNMGGITLKFIFRNL